MYYSNILETYNPIEGFVIYGISGSQAEEYADRYGITFVEKILLVNNVKLNKTTASLTAGNTLQLKAAISPSNATNKTMTWKSSKTSVATVDKNGKVTAKGVGTATISVTTEDGGKTATCKITVTKPLSKTKITLSNTTYVYNGSARKPTVTVKDGKTTLNKGTHYTVKYTNNKNAGKATVTITGKGYYTGTVNKTFKINPKSTTLTSVTGESKGFTAKWKKQATQTTGYQIQYSKDKNFKSGNKTATVKGNTKTSKKIDKLESGKTYYVRVRTYKTVSGKKYCSSWSKAKTVKIK